MKDLEEVLIQFIKSSANPILFLGAGASVKAGLPTWNGLVEEMANVIRESDPPSAQLMERSLGNNDLDKAAQYFYLCSELQETKKLRAIMEILNNYDASKLQDLAKLPISDVVTTNYDRSIIDAIGQVRNTVPVLTHFDDATLKSLAFMSENFVVRLHGRSEDPKNILLTRDDLEQASSTDSYRQVIRHLFTRRQILFIGYSFADPAITSVVSEID